ncbi:DivIVA domain-containing protein [Kineococcus sp. R8]|uniref:DivIVA domain-containing protein n=1 Tax=Kineococcus siccus TaxID=2696567 RepID=UPI0014128162|nr:DivIVA domain-containing protein [Kineococcus siccus]NAZ82416.1 DivIVA domain-containing protein [Kineococcus siccus]
MPLTPEDVVNKRFNPTRVREGYAQDEVDDFLDEVVAELRRLTSENDDLRTELTQCRHRVGELTRAASAAEAAPPVDLGKPAPVVEAAPEPEPEPEPAPEPEPEPVVAAPAVAQTPADQAAGVIALAQRLHDEYVRDGESQREALVTQAQAEAARLVAEAEQRRDATLGELDTRRLQLEDTIRSLRGREVDYREQLERFIATQLEQLKSSARIVPDDAVAL